MALHSTIEDITLLRSHLNWMVGLVLEITCVEAREIIMSRKFKSISCVQDFFLICPFCHFLARCLLVRALVFCDFSGDTTRIGCRGRTSIATSDTCDVRCTLHYARSQAGPNRQIPGFWHACPRVLIRDGRCQHTCQHDVAVRRGLGGRKRRSADGAEGDIAAISPAGAPLWSRYDAASVTALQCRGPIYSTWATWAEIGPHFFLFSKGRKSTTLALIRLCVELGLKRKILSEPCATR